MLFRNTRVDIHLNHFKENLDDLKKMNGKNFFCPMIKANAYGHGDRKIVKALIENKVKYAGVVLLEEALELSDFSNKINLLVFGQFAERELLICQKEGFVPVISSMESLRVLKKIKRKIKIHIKLDTGMNRLGFKENEWKKVRNEIDLLKNVEVEGICTHFLNSEESNQENGITTAQINLYKKAENLFNGLYKYSHTKNSAALILNPSRHGSRPGLAIYGCLPNENCEKKVNLKPVMSLCSSIVQIKKIKKNETVSYGATWKASRDSVIGVMAIGYADGFSRFFSNNLEVILHSQKVPVIGRVCMDYTMLDLTHLVSKADVKIGDQVLIWGKMSGVHRPIREVADQINTIPYTLLTGISSRVPRNYIGDK